MFCMKLWWILLFKTLKKILKLVLKVSSSTVYTFVEYFIIYSEVQNENRKLVCFRTYMLLEFSYAVYYHCRKVIYEVSLQREAWFRFELLFSIFVVYLHNIRNVSTMTVKTISFFYIMKQIKQYRSIKYIASDMNETAQFNSRSFKFKS